MIKRIQDDGSKIEVGASEPPSWCIAGSYVLVALAGGGHCADIDLFYLKGSKPPTAADAKAWLDGLGLPVPDVSVQAIGLDDMKLVVRGFEFAAAQPFNMDYWVLGDDGEIWELDQNGQRQKPLEGIPGPLSIVDAGGLNRCVATKALRKMKDFPALADPEVEDCLQTWLEANPPREEPDPERGA